LSDNDAQSAPKKIKKFAVKDIQSEHFFSEPVYIDKQFVLAAPEMPFSREMIDALKEWEFSDVYSAGEPTEAYVIKSHGKAESEEASTISNIADSTQLTRAEEFYAGLMKYTKTIFNNAALKSNFNFHPIASRIKDACEIIREDKLSLLIAHNDISWSPPDNYVVSHSVKTTIISLIIGMHLKLPNHKLIDLGVSALMHDIGMIKLPPRMYMTNRPLKPEEQKAIAAHPVLGFNMLKASDFPLAVNLAALEHHERENGSGYPRSLSGERISQYAKIIAVACSFEALSAERPHKEAKDGYTGMLELLKNQGKQYDDNIVRALVFSLSIYPIGMYVLLSNGRRGQVVDVNPENPRYPIVQVFGDINPDSKNKVLLTSQDELSIVRPLTKEELRKDKS